MSEQTNTKVASSGDSVLFGYGSLILPTSLIARFNTVEPGLEHVYAGNTDPNLRAEALEIWNQQKNRITYFPIKLSGFRRYYSIPSKHGGTMLEVVQTGNSSDYINGVLIMGLDQKEQQEVVGTEPGYEYLSLTDPNIEYYIDPVELPNMIPEDQLELKIFVSKKPPSAADVDSERNYTYHNRILSGIKMMEEMYGEHVAKRFHNDFLRSTYEITGDQEDSESFVNIARKDQNSGDDRTIDIKY